MIEAVRIVLDELGIPYAEDGWAPLRPPQNGPCIVYREDVEYDGSDEMVMWAVRSSSLDLYDDGSKQEKSARKKVAEALASANIKFEMYQPTYIYSEKKYMTVFYLEDYYEKEI